MDLVKFNKKATLQQAKGSTDPNKVYFPTDSHAIVLGGKEYGGVTTNELTNIVSTVNHDMDLLDDKVDVVRAEINAAQLEIGAVQTDSEPTENSTNHLTSGVIYTALQNVTQKEITVTTSPVVIEPNNLYKLGDRTSLNVSFISGEEGILNEYMFEFTVVGDSFSLTLPSTVKWIEELDFTPGYIYQISVVNNLAIGAGWEVSND